MAGRTLGDLLRDETFFATAVRHVRGLREAALAIQQPQYRHDQLVEVFYGEPGTGKTERAYAFDPGLYSVEAPNSDGGALWFDGYDGQSTLLLDDFEGGMNPRFLLRLLDRYPLSVQVKGASVALKTNRIILTSNIPPDRWYAPGDRGVGVSFDAALMRRIHRITLCTSRTESTTERDVNPEAWERPGGPRHTPDVVPETPLDVPNSE